MARSKGDPQASRTSVGGVEVEVRRSRRRRRTVSAYREGDTVVVMVPDSLTAQQEQQWVASMVDKLERRARRSRRTDEDLMRRARELSDAYLGGIAQPDSVRWVANQQSRWGSCTPGVKSIRLSSRLQTMPVWVQDYVLVHELAHLIEPSHNDAFWAWVANYPKAERAKGYLLGYSAGLDIDPPPGEADDDDDAGGVIDLAEDNS